MRSRDAPRYSMARADFESQRSASIGSHRSSSRSSLRAMASFALCRDACAGGRPALTPLAMREEQSLPNTKSTSSFGATPLWPGQKEILAAAAGWAAQTF